MSYQLQCVTGPKVAAKPKKQSKPPIDSGDKGTNDDYASAQKAFKLQWFKCVQYNYKH